MVDVFLCHAPADSAIAAQIAARLERGAEASVWLDPCGRDAPQTLPAAWDGGSSSTAILLLLSPDSLPQSLPIRDWQPLLKHLEGNAAPDVGAVLLDSCPFPKLLERKRFFRWSDSPNDVLRRIERWIVGLHRDDQPSAVPAPLPWFRGRERELAALWSALVDESGMVVLLNPQPRSGKSALAQEFARLASGHFRDIVWHGSGDLRTFLPRHRQLLVLDALGNEPPAVACEQGRASVLITSRRRDLNFPPHARIIEIDCVDSGGHVEWPSEPSEIKLLEAMSVCRPQSVPLQLAARVAGLNDPDARSIADRLAERRLIDPVEATSTYFRLIHGKEPTDALRLRHSQILHKAFSDWRKQPEPCSLFLGELEPGFEFAAVSDWNLAIRLAAHAFAFLRAVERLPEAVRLYSRLRDAARERNDEETVQNCCDELAWISDGQGATRSIYVSADQLRFEFA